MKSIKDMIDPETIKRILSEKFPLGNPLSLDLPNQTSFECALCNDSGVLHSMIWVDDPSYLNRFGELIRYQRAKVSNCPCRFEKMFKANNAALGMKEEERSHTFENATIDYENAEHFKMAQEFIRGIDKHRELGTWLYIYGDDVWARKEGLSAFGTGKSFLAHCIGNALTAMRIPAIYVTEDKLFQDVKDTYNRDSSESESDVLNRYYNVPILIIDDLFTAQYKEWAEAKLYSILEKRKDDKKITIITTNYAPDRIFERLPINGKKISSRLIGQSQLLEMIGRDRREQQAIKKYDKRREWFD
jgi:DNA replication protein DnaC